MNEFLHLKKKYCFVLQIFRFLLFWVNPQTSKFDVMINIAASNIRSYTSVFLKKLGFISCKTRHGVTRKRNKKIKACRKSV